MRPIDRSDALVAGVVIGLALVLGCWCRFQINGRRFRRRTIGGGQRFPSYSAAVYTQLWEGVAIWGATLLLAAAAVGALWLTAVLYRLG